MSHPEKIAQHPGAKAHGASPLHKLAAKAAPIVYYYMPQKPQKRAAMHPVHKVQMLNDTDAAGGDAAGDAFVCTVDNIKALSATVQGEWDKCKDHKDYKEPNAGASRRLLGWVWEPDHMGEKKTRVPAHLPSHYRLKLDEGTRNLARNAHHQQLAHMAHFQSLDNATNGTDAAGGGAEKSFEDCEKEAAEKACAQLAGCAEPVCENYYNEPEIEALCGICTMAPLGGCFAQDAKVEVQGRVMPLGQVAVGDRVLAAAASGAAVESRVIFVHDHVEASPTLRISYGSEIMELTPDHLVPLVSKECGDSYCTDAKLVASKHVKVGDKLYVSSVGPREVTAVTRAHSKVRYVLTEHDTLVVNGVVASVYSTAAGSLETLPFRLFDRLFAGGLQWAPIAAAMQIILESPLLRSFETVVNKMGELERKTAMHSHMLGMQSGSAL